MRRALVLSLLLSCACATTPAPEPRPPDEQTLGAIRQLTDAVAQQPANMPWIYVLATLHDRARQTEDVVRWLARLDELGWENGVNPVDFRNSAGARAFRDVAARLDARMPRVARARVAFTLAGQRDLVPEGIAYDPADDVFYVSGIHRRKVLRVTRDGRMRDFVAEGQDGMLGGLGVKVDARRRLLWVISSTTREMSGHVEGQSASMLASYDLRSGALVKKIVATPAILNDLTLLDDGSLFATDMGRHRIVRLAAGADALEDFAEDFRFPNGIAVSDDQRSLYVADFRGITRIDLGDESRQRIETNALLGGIDGLLFHRGTLVGIQNAIGRPRVVRVHLADRRVEVLEAKHPRFELPTTAALAEDELWFIANPGLRSFDDGRIWPQHRLEDPVMLRLPL